MKQDQKEKRKQDEQKRNALTRDVNAQHLHKCNIKQSYAKLNITF